MRNMGRFMNWARDRFSVFNQRKNKRREKQVGEVTRDGYFHVSALDYKEMKGPKPGGFVRNLKKSGPNETLKVPDRRQRAAGLHDIAFHVPSSDRRRKKPTN